MKPVLVGNWHDRPEVMRRALESCAAHVSGAAISVDPNHPEDAAFLQAECVRLALPAHIYETPRAGHTGGSLRTEVMREGEAFAKNLGAEYLVNLDADDELAFDEGFRWPSGAPLYCITEHHERVSWPFPRVFKVGLEWKWYGPIHEEPYCETVPLHSAAPTLSGVRYLKHSDGDREPNPVRYLKLAEVCRAWLADHPADARYAFYLARSLHAAGRMSEAVEAYEAFLERPDGSRRQRYDAALSIAHAMGTTGCEPLRLVLLLARVIEIAPERAEPYRALEWLGKHMADTMPLPADAYMVDASTYGARI